MNFCVRLNVVDGNQVKVLLDGPMIVRDSVEIKTEFAALLQKCHQAEIHLDGITRIDIAGLQLLTALRQSATTAGKSFTFANSSAQVQTIISLAGFTKLLMC